VLIAITHTSLPIEPTGPIEPELGSETQTDSEGLQNTGVLPGIALLVGGALEHGQGFPSEAGKAITKSLGDSASADEGGAASTVVNLPNTGYTVLKAADDDPGVVGKTSHVLFGGKAETRANTADV
jgi:hypothetical protein